MSTALIDDDTALSHAARFLNVSPQYLQQLLQQGKVNLHTLAAYKEQQQLITQQALQQLADQAQELNLGY
jgi:hypothetical protein